MTGDLGPSRAQIARMRGNITTLIVAEQRRQRRQLRLALSATAAVVAASLMLGVAATLPERITAGTYVCFTADDTGSAAHGMPYPLDLEPPDTIDGQVAAAIIVCGLAYEREGVEAPAPTVCRLADLRLAVFPNLERRDRDGFCAALGLLDPRD